MSNDKKSKDYNWIIFFFLIVGAVVRFLMGLYEFQYIDIFIAFINLIGLDYTITVIVHSIYGEILAIIDKSQIVEQAKINKKKKQNSFIYITISILILYNIFHLLFLSNSIFNDMLSMIVLGLSLTDNSIIPFIVRNKKI